MLGIWTKCRSGSECGQGAQRARGDGDRSRDGIPCWVCVYQGKVRAARTRCNLLYTHPVNIARRAVNGGISPSSFCMLSYKTSSLGKSVVHILEQIAALVLDMSFSSSSDLAAEAVDDVLTIET